MSGSRLNGTSFSGVSLGVLVQRLYDADLKREISRVWPSLPQKTVDLLVTPHKCKQAQTHITLCGQTSLVSTSIKFCKCLGVGDLEEIVLNSYQSGVFFPPLATYLPSICTVSYSPPPDNELTVGKVYAALMIFDYYKQNRAKRLQQQQQSSTGPQVQSGKLWTTKNVQNVQIRRGSRILFCTLCSILQSKLGALFRPMLPFTHIREPPLTSPIQPPLTQPEPESKKPDTVAATSTTVSTIITATGTTPVTRDSG